MPDDQDSEQNVDDQSGSQQTAYDQSQDQGTTEDQSQEQSQDQGTTDEQTQEQTSQDQTQDQGTTDDQNQDQQTPEDQTQDQGTTDDQSQDQQTPQDQTQDQETTDEQSQEQTSQNQTQDQGVTDEQSQNQQTPRDQAQNRQTIGDQAGRQTTQPGVAGSKQSFVGQTTGATQTQSTGTTNIGVPIPPGFQKVEGIDVSSAQGRIDWNAVKRSGTAFAYVKATDGKDPDATFRTNWAGAAGAGISRGAYHFFYPVPVGSDHLQKQVDAFLAQMGSLAANDLPPMVDVEVPPAGQEKWLVRAMTAQEIAASLTYWLSKVAQGCGRQPVIYTFPAYWQSRMGDSSSFHAFHLWIANWGSETSPGSKEFRPLGKPPIIPGRWPAFSIWQYAVLKGLTGINGLVDRDLIILRTGMAIVDFLNASPPNPNQP